MTIVRWTPARSLLDLRSEMDRLFNNLMGSKEEDTGLASFIPVVDIEEHDKAIVISVELPGVKKDDVNLKVAENLLTISGEKKQEKKVDEKNLHRVERIYGSFQRTFRLPDYIDQQNVSAEFKDGVLIISLPKLKETISKQIEIKVK